MKTQHRLTILLLIILLSGCANLGWEDALRSAAPAPSPMSTAETHLDIQVFVTGHVINSSGKPVVGADVFAQGYPWFDTTDSKGQFMMYLRPGSYQLVAKLRGYRTGPPTKIDIVANKPLEDVTISYTPHP